MRHLTGTVFLLLCACGPLAAAPKVDPIAAEADRRAPDSEVLRRAARRGPGARRRAALRAMGRIQSPSYLQALLAALADRSPAVADEAAFALGQLAIDDAPAGDGPRQEQQARLRAAVSAALVPLLAAGRPGLRCAAAQALGKTGGPAAEESLLVALRGSPACLRGQAVLGLFRLRYLKRVPEYSSATVAGLLAAAQDPDPGVRWKAAYAFSRWPEPRAAAGLAAAASDPDLWTRVFAVRGLGQLKGAAPVDVLLKAQGDPEAWVRREAVAALAAGAWAGKLDDAVFRDPSVHVRAAAAAALASDPDPQLASRLDGLLADPSALVRAEALAAVPKLRPDARAVLLRERASPNGYVRSRAYSVLAEVPGARPELLEGLRDPEPQVAAAALEAVAKSTEGSVIPILDAVLRDPQSAMELRGTAADAAGELKSPALADALRIAWANSSGREWSEVRDSIKKAAEAIAPADRFAEPAGGTPRISPFLGARPAPASVVLETQRGDIEIALAAAEAPVHAAAFLHSVRAGLYDGLTWHRVVSGFVIQGGDPRGSGWGDAGFSLRDEINPLPFERGTVGMPKAGKDTGGCQIFITHLPAPHLDGRYTVFGRVTRGLDVVDRIEPGDLILKARVLGGS